MLMPKKVFFRAVLGNSRVDFTDKRAINF